MALSMLTWAPVAFLLFLCCLNLGLSSPITSAATLALICQEQGFASNCTEVSATKALSQYHVLSAIVTGGLMFFSVGFWSTFAHKIGRRITLFSSIAGLGLQCILECAIFSGILNPYWKPWLIGSTAIVSITGTVVVVFLGVFGYVNDVTHDYPEHRAWIYSILETIIGSTALISSSISRYIINYPFQYTILAVGVIYLIIALGVLLFLPESIPPEERLKHADWKSATLITALGVLLPRSSSNQIDSDDIDSDENDKNAHLENEITDEDLSTQNRRVTNDEQYYPHINQFEDDTNKMHAVDQAIDLNDDEEAISRNSINPIASQETIISPESPPPQTSSPSKQSKTPHNMLLVLAVSFFLSMIVLYGRRSITFAFFSATFHSTKKDYTTMLFLDSLGNAVMLFIILPLIKRFMQHSLLIQLSIATVTICLHGIGYLLIAFSGFLITPSPQTLAYPFIILFIVGIVSSVPSGILRAAMVNAAHTKHDHHRILGSVTAIEALCKIGGEAIFNIIFRLSPWLGAAFCSMGGFYIFAAFLIICASIYYIILQRHDQNQIHHEV